MFKVRNVRMFNGQVLKKIHEIRKGKTLSIKDHFYGQKGQRGQRGQWFGVQKDTTRKMTVSSVEMDQIDQNGQNDQHINGN